MQQLYNIVRGTGATNLIFASGVNWAESFPSTAPLTGTRNLIYAAHAYTCPTGLPSTGATCTTGPDGTIYDPSRLLGNLSIVPREHATPSTSNTARSTMPIGRLVQRS